LEPVPTKTITKLLRLFTKLLRLIYVRSLTGSKYTKELAARRCPKCQELLPNNIEYMENFIIGMVGDTASGKSHYIAALINALEQGEALNGVKCIGFIPKGDTQVRYENEYYGPLFVDKTVITATALKGDEYKYRPLIFEMVFAATNNSDRKKYVNLVLFDAGGEDMKDPKGMAILTRYILKASGLIFLVDPMSIQGVVREPSALPQPNVVRASSSFSLLYQVIDMCRMEKGIKPGDKIKTPIVIAVSKSDLLNNVTGSIGMQPSFTSEPSYRDGFHLQDYDTTNDEVQEVLRRFNESAILKTSEAFENVSFSAFSATGMSPDQFNRFSSVKPCRCVDPLLWLLWKLNIIEAKASE